MVIKRILVLLLLLVVLMLAACGIEVPPEKQTYVGEWRGLGMRLTITTDGSVDYQRKKGGGSTSINAPLQGFEGDNFIVGVGVFDTTFVVNRPPWQERDQWKMVVDGVELTRIF